MDPADYDRKKYVWKLLYIYMLGYDVEFGHKQAADLIPASKYAPQFVCMKESKHYLVLPDPISGTGLNELVGSSW